MPQHLFVGTVKPCVSCTHAVTDHGPHCKGTGPCSVPACACPKYQTPGEFIKKKKVGRLPNWRSGNIGKRSKESGRRIEESLDREFA